MSARSIKDKLPPSLRTRLGTAQFSITFVTLGELTQWATFRKFSTSAPDSATAASTTSATRGRTVMSLRQAVG